jgi:hypothetical protein
MNQTIYRGAMKQAWLLVWRNTSLWLLGLLSALFAGSFGLSNFFSQLAVTMSTGGQAGWLVAFNFPALGVSKISAVFWLLWLTGILLVLALAVIYISVTAKAALLIAMADYYKKKTMPKLGKIWNEGLKFFWNIFTIETARKIILCVIVVIFGCIWLILPFNESAFNLVINIIALTLAVLLGWTVSALSVFTAGYAVIDKQSLRTAFKRSWELFHHHLLVSFEISVLLTLLDLALIAVFLVIVYFAFIPSLFIWIIAGAFSSTAIALVGTIVGFIIMIFIFAIFGAVYNTFYTSVWMYLFMKMHHEGIMSRGFHHLGRLIKGR